MVNPTVLVAATDRWFPTARLAVALHQAGFNVEAVCPSGHPMIQSHAVSKTHRYSGLLPLASFARAMNRAAPEIIVPADDLATDHLHALHRRGSRAARELIERSLGRARSFPVIRDRAAFIRLAVGEGVLAPWMQPITSRGELQRWVAERGFPAVIKANGTSGGDGVRIVKNPNETEHAFQSLSAPPSLARATKRALLDRDSTLLWRSMLRRRPVVNAQQFVPGCDATSTVVCWKGSVLASLHFEVVCKADPNGHATVVRAIENRDMEAASERMVRKLQLSGFHGFDFVIESATNRAHLIEINARATQVGHLALGAGRDLPAALYTAVTGHSRGMGSAVTQNDTIALFPQEWIRDAFSPFLQFAYHDVPWQEPELIRACILSRRTQSVWYTRNPGALDSERATEFSLERNAAEPKAAPLPGLTRP